MTRQVGTKKQEIEITPEMIEAVETELACWTGEYESVEEKAIAVIKAVLANLH